jgi:predicted  nucleic acid-binding Zn-ribbon protein
VTSKPIACIVITVLMLGITSTALQDDVCAALQQPIPPMSRPNPEEEARRKMERDMAKKANEERHAALKRDTDRLLRLSTELKEFVDKSNENTLSLDVIKKAEEIEKLAHSVREKMKGN